MKKKLMLIALITAIINAQTIDTKTPPKFKERIFTLNKLHQYLGIGAIVAGIVAGGSA